MTASLADFQQDALEKLLDPACPRQVVVRSAVGSGIRRGIEAIIRQVAVADRVLVLTPMRLLAEQWRDRLSEENNLALTLLTADTALDLLEHPHDQRGQVLVAIYASATHGPSRRALAELDYGLIIYDDLVDLTLDRLGSLNDRAQRVIALSSPSSSQVPDWPVAVDITAADLEAATGGVLVSQILFTSSQTESGLQREVDQLLDEYAGNAVGRRDRAGEMSIASLHALLLDLAADLPQAPETGEREDRAKRNRLLRRAWNLIDRVESIPATDSRLHALDNALAAELARGSRCLIIAVKVSDLSYIASHLASTGRPPAALVTSHTAAADRKRALQSLQPGECIVAGAGISPHLDDVPTPYTVILWSGNLGRIIDQVAGVEGVRILQLAEVERLH